MVGPVSLCPHLARLVASCLLVSLLVGRASLPIIFQSACLLWVS